MSAIDALPEETCLRKLFDLPTSLRDSAWRQPTFVPQMSNEIVESGQNEIFRLPPGGGASNSRKRSQSVAT